MNFTADTAVRRQVKMHAGRTESEVQKERFVMNDNKRNGISYSVWMLAGLYLIYTAYGLFTSEKEKGMLHIVSIAVFAVFGLFFMIAGGKGLFRIEKEKRAAREEAAARERKPEGLSGYAKRKISEETEPDGGEGAADLTEETEAKAAGETVSEEMQTGAAGAGIAEGASGAEAKTE